MPITHALCGASTPPSSPHSAMECPSETATSPVWLLSFKSSYLRWCWTPSAQPQGTAPQGDQYQQPGVPHQPSECKTHLGQTGWFQPCPCQWLPPCRHHCKQPCLMMPSQSAIHPLQPCHQKPLRQLVSLLPHNLRLILGQTWVPSWTKYSDCKGRWTGPWRDYFQPGCP